MVLRKPYALLIRYFQRIHLLLLALSVYVFYNVTVLRTFVNDFIRTESYNSYIEPISKYIHFGTYFSLLAIMAITITIIVLLFHKKKPWKLYLIPLIEYLFLFVIMIFVKNFFNDYNELSKMTTIMAGRDLLFLTYFPQFLVFIIFGIRLLGIDVKKFGFKNDEEYMDIKEEDREEFEVNIEIDKDKIKRNIKKLFRNIRYVYLEHRFICNGLILVFFLGLFGYSYYYFGVIHRTYKEGQSFIANGYQIKVNSSYLTERKSNGDLLKENSKYAYVIVNVTVKNLSNKRAMNIDRFRLMRKSKESEMISNYGLYFSEYGKIYDQREFEHDQERSFILIFQTDKKQATDKYVLYYQDATEDLLIKKTNLKIEDLRNLKTEKEVSLNNELKIDENDITFTEYKVGPSSIYVSYRCDDGTCGMKNTQITSYGNYILEISFASDSFDVKSLVDFSSKYAKIIYEDKDGKRKDVDVMSAITESYSTNALYLKVPEECKVVKKLNLYIPRKTNNIFTI